MRTGKRGESPLGPSSDPWCHPCLPATPSFSYFHGLIWFKSRLREKLPSFWELILILKSWPLPNSFGALGSPYTQRGRAPNEDCYRSITDNEGNNGDAIEEMGRNVGGAGTENRRQSPSSPSCTNQDKSKEQYSEFSQTEKFKSHCHRFFFLLFALILLSG